MLPFVWNNRLWQTGVAGSIPSMVAYVLGGMGIFRLVNGFTHALSQNQGKNGAPRVSLPAFVATAIYAFNPNLLYMQTTAMNEPIYIAFFLWALVYLQEMLRAGAAAENDRSSTREQALERCGICLAGGAWTRYDGWFTGAVVGAIVIIVVARWWRRETEAIASADVDQVAYWVSPAECADPRVLAGL